jgi:hypothetical protein
MAAEEKGAEKQTSGHLWRKMEAETTAAGDHPSVALRRIMDVDGKTLENRMFGVFVLGSKISEEEISKGPLENQLYQAL